MSLSTIKLIMLIRIDCCLKSLQYISCSSNDIEIRKSQPGNEALHISKRHVSVASLLSSHCCVAYKWIRRMKSRDIPMWLQYSNEIDNYRKFGEGFIEFRRLPISLPRN